MENGSEDFLLIREFATNSTIGESKLSDASNTVGQLNKKYGPRFYFSNPHYKCRNIPNDRLRKLINTMPIHAHKPGASLTVCRGSLGQMNAEFVDPGVEGNRITCEFCLIGLEAFP